MEGTAFLDCIQQLDQSVTLFINSIHSNFSNQLWQFCSNKIAWIPLYMFAVLFLVKHIGWKKTLLFTVAIGLGFLCCDQLANLVKYSVARLRPNYTYSMTHNGLMVLESRGGMFGFFSAHAANTFCTAVIFSKAIKSMKYEQKGIRAIAVSAYIWSALVAISRVFVGKHFFGDVLVGTIIGISMGLLFAKIAELAIKKTAIAW